MKKILGLLLVSSFLFVIPVSVQAAAPLRTTSTSGQMYADRLKIIEDRFNHTLSMYQEFITKLGSIRDSLQTQGKDVTKLDSALRMVDANFTSTKAAVTEAMANLKAIDYSQNKATVTKEVAAEVRSVRTAISKLHTSVVDAVKIIKTLRQS